MGIYSAQAAQLLKESEIQPDPNAAGLLEFAVNSIRSEQSMFEAMIEIDFMEYYSESGSIVLTEEEQEKQKTNIVKNIWDKIVEKLQQLWQTVSEFFEKLKNKFREFTKLDEKLYDRYGDLTKVDLGDKGEKEIKFLKQGYMKDSPAWKSIDSFGPVLEKILNTDSVTKEDIDKFAHNVDVNTADNFFDAQFVTKKAKDLENKDYIFISNCMSKGYSELENEAIGKGKAALDTIKKARDAARKQASLLNKDEDARKAGSDKFTLLSHACSALTKHINFSARSASVGMTLTRKAYIFLANAGASTKAKKPEKKEPEKKEKDVEESALYDELFEYAIEVATDNQAEKLTFA